MLRLSGFINQFLIMNKFLFSAFLSLFLLSGLQANNPVKDKWVKINSTTSQVNWVGKKVTGQHSGVISIKEGSLQITDGMLKGGNVTIDMTSIKTTDMTGEYAANLDGHLKADDFFGVDKFPTATLILTDVKSKGYNNYAVTGNLTIKGITKPVSFETKIEPDGSKYKATANITIDRTEFDIKYGSGKFFEGIGDKAIHDNFELQVMLVAE